MGAADDPFLVIQEQLNRLIAEHGYIAASAVVTDALGNQFDLHATGGLCGRLDLQSKNQGCAVH